MQDDALMVLAAVAVGVAAAGALVAWRDRASARQPWLMVLLFGLFAGLNAGPLVILLAPKLAPFYLPALLPMLFALVPVIYLFARSQSDLPQLPDIRRHLALPGAGLAVMLSFWLLPDVQRDAMLLDGALPAGWAPAILAIVTFGLVLLWNVTSLVYLVATIAVLQRHRAHLKGLYSNTHGRELRWIDVILVMLVALWLLMAMSLVFDNLGPGLPLPATLVLAMSIAVQLAIIGYARAPAATMREDDEAPETEADVTHESQQDQGRREKYARSALSPERAATIADRIERAMHEERLYLDPNLSLQKLARHVRVPPNHASQTINERLGASFFDYVAHWRIDAAKPAIAAGASTVLEIALEVGFNSRSTFYKAFRRETGMTPKAYRAAHFHAPSARGIAGDDRGTHR